MDTDDPIGDSLKIAYERGIRIIWSIQKKAMLLTQTQRLLLLN